MLDAARLGGWTRHDSIWPCGNTTQCLTRRCATGRFLITRSDRIMRRNAMKPNTAARLSTTWRHPAMRLDSIRRCATLLSGSIPLHLTLRGGRAAPLDWTRRSGITKSITATPDIALRQYPTKSLVAARLNRTGHGVVVLGSAAGLNLTEHHSVLRLHQADLNSTVRLHQTRLGIAVSQYSTRRDFAALLDQAARGQTGRRGSIGSDCMAPHLAAPLDTTRYGGIARQDQTQYRITWRLHATVLGRIRRRDTATFRGTRRQDMIGPDSAAPSGQTGEMN